MPSSSTTASVTMQRSVDNGSATERRDRGSSPVDRVALAAMIAAALLVPAAFDWMPMSAMRSAVASAAFALSPRTALASPKPERGHDGLPPCGAV